MLKTEIEHKTNKVEQLVYEIITRLKANNSKTIKSSEIIVLLYSLYQCKLNKLEKLSFDQFLQKQKDEGLSYYSKSILTDEDWKILKEVTKGYKIDTFKQAVFSNIKWDKLTQPQTPLSLSKLAMSLLDIKKDEKIADIGCGYGSFLIELSKKLGANFKYDGFELATDACVISRARASLLKVDASFYQCNAFELGVDKAYKSIVPASGYDRIFANYPFCVQLRNLGIGKQYIDILSSRCPDITKAMSSDWVFNSLICDLLSVNGKAVAIMTNGSTWNTSDKPIRQYFIENKLIEAVIALPAKLFEDTAIPTTMVVLSHNNNNIHMVDATNLYVKGRRQNEIDDENIKKIIERVKNDTEYSQIVTYNELKQNDFVLNPIRYLQKPIVFENGVKFEDIMKGVTRGAPITANELDELVSKDETDYQYISISDIKNGIIEKDLMHIKNIPTQYQKSCLKNKSIILTRNGNPFKVAVADIREHQKILAGGNIFIIEINEAKANPYYVKTFLESQIGMAQINQSAVGAFVPMLSIDAIKKLQIPLPSLAKQEEIANEYLAVMDEVYILRKKMDTTLDRLLHTFDRYQEGE